MFIVENIMRGNKRVENNKNKNKERMYWKFYYSIFCTYREDVEAYSCYIFNAPFPYEYLGYICSAVDNNNEKNNRDNNCTFYNKICPFNDDICINNIITLDMNEEEKICYLKNKKRQEEKEGRNKK